MDNLLPTPEPIRVPTWLYALIVNIVVPIAVAFLTDQPVKPVIASVLLASAGFLAVAERARTKVVPNEKVVEAVDAAKAISYTQGLYAPTPKEPIA